MNFDDIQKKDLEYVAHTYNRFPVTIVRGFGATGYAPDGNAYIDFSSGIGVNSLGFSDKGWADAVCTQAQTMQHISNLYYTAPDANVAEKLCNYTGYSKVFFGNSGAEANECAVKIARKYGMEKHGIECNTIITLHNSFHGRTITTLAATGQDVFHQLFYPLTEGFRYVHANNIEELEAVLDETVCGIMIELIQGEGGVIPVEPAFAKDIERICKERDLTFIVDEIQTGIGRTGTLLCCEQYQIHPDVVTLAKGLGGGLPIGAVLMAEHVSEVLGFGQHGSTFGGNPVSCAGAFYILEQIMNSRFLAEVMNKAKYITNALKEIPQITSVTGLGLMIGASLKERYSSAAVAKKCAESGLLILTAKTKLRFLPPLTITEAEMDAGISILKDVLASVES